MAGNKIKNTGVILEEPGQEDWVLGGISGATSPVVFPNGHGWLNYQRPEETQRNRNFDSFSCVSYASLKSLSYYFKVVHGLEMDFSERFTAVMSGTIPGRGNSVRAVLESIRKDGFIEEKYYPSMTPDMTEADWFRQPPASIKKMALDNLKRWKVEWEVLSIASPFTGEVSHEQIIEGQKKAVPILIGYAWDKVDDLYVDNNKPANHCFTGPDHEDVGPIIIADDSYPEDFGTENEPNSQYLKRLATSYSIRSAHIITVQPIGKTVKPSILTTFKNMFKNLKGYMDQKGLHIFYIDERGKQEIEIKSMAEKALFMAYLKEGVIPTTTWPAISTLPNFKFF